ncbi:MAG: hypothetical protein VB141_12500 [Burkholderia gladioli]
MSDEKKLSQNELIALGEQAKAVLENPAFKAACRELEAMYFKAWGDSDPKDTDGRERLFIHVAVQRTMIANLNAILGSGQISAAMVERARGRRT